MRLSYILFLSSLIISCGETEQEINSRNGYQSITRRYDVVMNEYLKNSEKEGSLSKANYQQYYNEYSQRISRLREELSGVTTSKKFNSIYDELDKSLGLSIEVINSKKDLFDDLSEIISTKRSYLASLEDAQDYIKKLKEDYSSIYSNWVQREAIEMVQDSIQLFEDLSDLKISFNEFNLSVESLQKNQSTLNYQLKELSFDTLSFSYSAADDELIQLVDTTHNLTPMTIVLSLLRTD